MTTDEQLTALDVDLLWKQYASNVDLYKFYLELSIKVNVFCYAVTGAILSYYFQHSGQPVAKYGLILPIVFSLSFGVVFLYGSSLLGVVRQEMFDIRDRLGFATAPEFLVLTTFLRVMGGTQLLVGVGLAVYLATVIC